MQTFLPYEDFRQTAQCLDNKRLGKQRVEAYQILRTLFGESSGWRLHPAVRMWAGYERKLLDYCFAICDEWESRGYKDTVQDKAIELATKNLDITGYYFTECPFWLGNKQLHLSHRSNLVRKYPEHYRKFWPDIADNLPYYWPLPSTILRKADSR